MPINKYFYLVNTSFDLLRGNNRDLGTIFVLILIDLFILKAREFV